MRKCAKCSEKGVIYLPQHRLALCKTHYLEWFENRVEKTVKTFSMFSKKDDILVAVSGGKDSLGVWHALWALGYKVDGLYINLGIGEYSELSEKKAKAFADKIGRKLHVVSLKENIADIPTLKELQDRPACSICGTLKRYYMNLTAKKLGYSVIVTGHNLDDECAVLMGNVLSWNIEYLVRQYPVLEEGNGFVRKVKPLCLVSEKESAMYAFLSGIDFVEDECPYSVGASSINYKLLMSKIEEESPGTKLRFYLEFIRKVRPMLAIKKDLHLRPCQVCGEPTTSDVCSVCRLRMRLENSKAEMRRDF
ncbi:TIGR00269 family protein [Thermocrinis sp.]